MTIFQYRAIALALAATLSSSFPAASAAAVPVEQILAALKENLDTMGTAHQVGNGMPFCSIGREVDRNVFVDNDHTAVFYAPAFRASHVNALDQEAMIFLPVPLMRSQEERLAKAAASAT